MSGDGVGIVTSQTLKGGKIFQDVQLKPPLSPPSPLLKFFILFANDRCTSPVGCVYLPRTQVPVNS